MPRALFLAEEAGIHATGLVSDLQPYGFQGEKSYLREVLSRVKAVADVTLDTPAMAGPQDPDRDHRRPRKLGAGAAAGHPARRLAWPLIGRGELLSVSDDKSPRQPQSASALA